MRRKGNNLLSKNSIYFSVTLAWWDYCAVHQNATWNLIGILWYFISV